MAKKDYNKLFDELIIDIIENNVAVRDAIKGRMSNTKFYDLLEDDKKAERYMRATEIRSDSMAQEILKISDNREGDLYIDSQGKEKVDHAVINRDRLRVDSRKWLMAKMQPKKYGDKTDITSGDKPLQTNLNVTVDDSKTAKALKELRDGLAKTH